MALLLAALLVACGSSRQSHPPTTAAVAVVEASATSLPESTATHPPPTAFATPLLPTASRTADPTATSLPPPSETPRPTPCAQAGRVVFGAFASAVAGGEHRYAAYLPPCYAADGHSYPTLYLLAGNVHDERKWVELGIDQAADRLNREGAASPFLIVMPDGGWLANNTSGGPGSYESLILDELIPHIEGHYCAWADPAARAIGGLSRGGYWALEIAFRFPQLFASVGGHSAALLDTFAGPAINPQHTALSSDLGNLRIFLDIGADDYVRANTIKLHEDMQAAGVAHEWRLNEGQHVDDYWALHAAEYLAWYAAPWPTDRVAYPGCNLLP